MSAVPADTAAPTLTRPRLESRRLPGGTLQHALPPVLAAVVWALSAEQVRLEEIGDFGLVQALPATAFLALALIVASFCWTLWRRPTTPLLLLHVVALIVMLYGASAIVAEEPPVSIAWRHVGIADSFIATGDLERTFDAYFNWPGFFALLAFVADISGADSSLSFVLLAPLVLNLLYLPPLVVLARAATVDRRLVWASVWVFYLANWIGQDYLSPQGLNYFLYLAALATLLTFFRRGASPTLGSGALAEWARRVMRDRPAPYVPRYQRAVLAFLIIAIAATVVASHQLTPFALLMAVAVLGVARRTSARGLALVLVVLTASWLLVVAVPYLDGHVETLKAQVGDVGGSVGSNVGSRVSGSDDHQFIVGARLAMTALLWSIALAGAVARIRQGRAAGSHILLALAPFPLLALQSYGGEALLRVYLFALPFMAFLAASSISPALRLRRWASWRAPALLAALSLVLAAGFLFTRYGNDRAVYFTHGDVATVEHLYDIAPPGALLTAPNSNLPWQHRGYTVYRHEILTRRLPDAVGEFPPSGPGLANALASYMDTRGPAPAAYLVVTRSARIFDALLGSNAWGTVESLEQALRSSPRFDVAYSTDEGTIYELEPPEEGRG